ncbi:sensor histidine kinase [Microbacterium sp. NPDC089695]|uniref:sensor histidine kinase n=1 Tax=Microbacterium sp. NPDC089695 TaxID=3364198 RepID=UPI00381F6DD1
MSSPSLAVDRFGDPPPGARQLARGITATWWYTLSAVLFIELFLVLIWALRVFVRPGDVVAPLVVGAGGLVWWLSTVLLLSGYRRGVQGEPVALWTRVVPFALAVAFGVASGVIADSWLFAVTPLAQSLALLLWPRGVRRRVVVFATIVLFILAFIDGMRGTVDGGIPGWLPSFYAVLIPAMSVSSLWWWDVLVTLDRARASEARLAATQERLRVATDVHDLQGHHLQVIALQLELAERLMARDADAALEQLRAARVSVDEARQGTRDLATRFRSVPLGDEVANARDLLSAAGIAVEADIDVDADAAPASALGPVIRETTTNVLRHGAGSRAHLSLRRDAGTWRYEVTNDVVPGAERGSTGSGLDGVRRRLAEVGGTLEVREQGDDFTVIVAVPEAESRPAAGEGER